jgi:hypothetical protein
LQFFKIQCSSIKRLHREQADNCPAPSEAVSTRAQNEKKFGQWTDLPSGGRMYWLDVSGRQSWRARYWKEVDSSEATLRFWQEI